MADKFVSITPTPGPQEGWQIDSATSIMSVPSNLRCEISDLPKVAHLFYNTRRTVPTLGRKWEIVREKYQKIWIETGESLFNNVLGRLEQEQLEGVLSIDGPLYLVLSEESDSLPWELLWNNVFLDSGASSPIVRYLGQDFYTPSSIRIEKPELLFLGAEPENRPTQAGKLWSRILRNAPVDHEQVVNQVSRKHKENQWEAFIEMLRSRRPNIVHIVAHGLESKDGFLLEGSTNRDEIEIQYEGLAKELADVESVRLLILSICYSGERFRKYFEHLFSKAGLAAAVVMATEISATAAILFCGYLYDSLWSSNNVADAVGSSRNTIRTQTSERFSLEWSTPMLYQKETVYPFTDWLEEMQQRSHNAPIQDEHYKEVKHAATGIQLKVDSLVRLQRQVRISAIRETILMQEVDDHVQRLNDSLTLFNQGYEPRAQRWLDDLRVTTSHSLPTIKRFIYYAGNKRTSSSEITQLGLAAINASNEILSHFEQE